MAGAIPALAQVPPIAPDQDCSAYYEVLIIDVSGSIAGRGTDPIARNILREVKTSVSAHLNGLGTDARIGLLPFGGKDETFQVFPAGLTQAGNSAWANLSEPARRQGALEFIDKVDALGQSTHIVPAVDRALRALSDAQRLDPGNLHCSAVYLYTDGLDNEPGRTDWQRDVADRLSTFRRQDLPFLFAAWVQMPGTGNFTCPQGFNNCGPLSHAQWRIKTPEPGSILDFGTLNDANLQSALRMLEFEEIAAAVVPPGGTPPAPKLTFSITPGPAFDAEVLPAGIGLSRSVEVRLRARASQAAGERTGILSVGLQDAFLVGRTTFPVKYRFELQPASTRAVWRVAEPQTILDFGVLSDANPLSNSRTLAFEEIQAAVAPPGAATVPATVAFSVTADEGGAFEADLVPVSAPLATRIDLALRARPGQVVGEHAGVLHLAIQDADWAGPTEIRIRYTYEGSEDSWGTALRVLVAFFALTFVIGVADNFKSRTYQVVG